MILLRGLFLSICLSVFVLPAWAQDQGGDQTSSQAPTQPAAQVQGQVQDPTRNPDQMTFTLEQKAAGEAAKTLNDWDQSLATIDSDLKSDKLDHQQRNKRRLTLVDIAGQATKASQRFGQEQVETQRLLDALGPPPADGQPAEAPEVLAERKKLDQELAAVSALKGRSDLIVARANLMLRQLDEVRIKAFADELLQQSSSLLRQSTWQAVPASLASLRASINARLTPRNLASEDDDQTRRFLLGLGALAVMIVAVPVIRRLSSWLDRRRAAGQGDIPYGQRVVAAVLETALRFVLPSFALLFLLLTFLAVVANTTWGAVFEPVAFSLASGIGFAFFLAAVGHATIAPKLPNWGVVLLSPASARALYRRWLLASGFLGFVLAMRMITFDLQPDPVLESIANALEALIGSLILLSLLPAHLWLRPDAEQPEAEAQADTQESQESEEAESGSSSLAWLGEARWLRLVALFCALVVLVAAVLGYVALSDYIALAFMTIVGVGFVLLVLRQAVRDSLHSYLFRQQQKRGGWLRLFIKSGRGLSFFEFLIFALLDGILLLIALFAVLPSLGMAEDEVQVWLYSILQGFAVGGVTVKPLNILMAIAVFVVILGVTRFIQRRLRRGVLASITPENSVQQSISTGIGYVGVIAAILLGINVVGFDLTNLALIAGALSVGIGFGLQNIVSNFVSGIILLIERPIKVGDWVIVGTNEGVVKRISVRATEIETWQRSSVLVPNSDLVSTAVTNWTHKNKLGRVDVAVRVPFGTDPQVVHDLLMKSAEDCKRVLAQPPSYVFFKAFSPDGMDFDIRVYVPDIYELIIQVSNDLRMAVVKHFGEAGIEMALPQRVVHLADNNRLDEEALRRQAINPSPDGEEPAPGR